jgi:predicted transcriptional regulator
MPLPSQIRAARALIGWSQQRLAKAANVSLAALNNLERSITDPRVSTVSAVQAALEKAGVEFTNGGEPGVKMKAKPKGKRR